MGSRPSFDSLLLCLCAQTRCAHRILTTLHDDSYLRPFVNAIAARSSTSRVSTTLEPTYPTWKLYDDDQCEEPELESHKNETENNKEDRPICSLPAVCKLFTTVLYGRLFPRLDQIQSEDQARFRRTCQAMDHMTPYRMIEQRCHEWGFKIWVATNDVMKAFDSMTLNSIWNAFFPRA